MGRVSICFDAWPCVRSKYNTKRIFFMNLKARLIFSRRIFSFFCNVFFTFFRNAIFYVFRNGIFFPTYFFGLGRFGRVYPRVISVELGPKCGLTPQYKGLQALQDTFKDRPGVRDKTLLGCNPGFAML